VKSGAIVLTVLAVLVVTVVFVEPFLDGHIEVTGTVYEWTNPPAGQSTLVLWSEGLPDEVEAVPIAGAAVTVFHGRDFAKEPIDESTELRDDAVTDLRGGLLDCRSDESPPPSRRASSQAQGVCVSGSHVSEPRCRAARAGELLPPHGHGPDGAQPLKFSSPDEECVICGVRRERSHLGLYRTLLPLSATLRVSLLITS
jgi:hypothetical protein